MVKTCIVCVAHDTLWARVWTVSATPMAGATLFEREQCRTTGLLSFARMGEFDVMLYRLAKTRAVMWTDLILKINKDSTSPSDCKFGIREPSVTAVTHGCLCLVGHKCTVSVRGCFPMLFRVCLRVGTSRLGFCAAKVTNSFGIWEVWHKTQCTWF